MDLNVYLSGEIHTDWRKQIKNSCEKHNLPIIFTYPVTDHNFSDSVGDLLDTEEKNFWRDHKSAKINAIRTKTLIRKCDLAVIRFGDEYKQWNSAFEAGYCAAIGTPYITLHNDDLVHPLKEVDALAMAWAKTSEQVVEILRYVTNSELT